MTVDGRGGAVYIYTEEEASRTHFMTRRFRCRPGSVRLTQTELDADQTIAVLAGVDGPVAEETACQDDASFVRIAQFVVTFAICFATKTIRDRLINYTHGTRYRREEQSTVRGGGGGGGWPTIARCS